VASLPALLSRLDPDERVRGHQPAEIPALGTGGWGRGSPRCDPSIRPPVAAVEGADCFAYAALDATSTPTIDPADLAHALNAADAELLQPGPWPW